MQVESRRSFGVTTAIPVTHDLRGGLARVGFLAAVLAGMVTFAAVEHHRDTALLKSPVTRPA